MALTSGSDSMESHPVSAALAVALRRSIVEPLPKERGVRVKRGVPVEFKDLCKFFQSRPQAEVVPALAFPVSKREMVHAEAILVTSSQPGCRMRRRHFKIGISFVEYDSQSPTSATLLARLRQLPPDQAAWDKLAERYGRRIYAWCRQWNLQDADAQDVTQTVLFKLVERCSRLTTTRRAASGDGYGPWRGMLAATFWDSPAAGLSLQVAARAAEIIGAAAAREDLMQRLEEEFDWEILEEAMSRVRQRALRRRRRRTFRNDGPRRRVGRRGGESSGDECGHGVCGQEQSAEIPPRGEMQAGRRIAQWIALPPPNRVRRPLCRHFA